MEFIENLFEWSNKVFHLLRRKSRDYFFVVRIHLRSICLSTFVDLFLLQYIVLYPLITISLAFGWVIGLDSARRSNQRKPIDRSVEHVIRTTDKVRIKIHKKRQLKDLRFKNLVDMISTSDKSRICCFRPIQKWPLSVTFYLFLQEIASMLIAFDRHTDWLSKEVKIR